MPEPTPDHVRRRIEVLARAGKPRNHIARELGVAPSTVSRIAGQLGLSFDRSRVKSATEAKLLDIRAGLAELQSKLLVDAHRLEGQLWQPCKVFAFGGRDNVYAEETLSEPDAKTKRELLTSVAIAVDKIAAIERIQDREGQGKAAILRLVDTLTAAVDSA